MAKAVTTAPPAANRFPSFSPAEIADALKIAAKLALLSRENLIFVDGYVTGALMAQGKEVQPHGAEGQDAGGPR